MYNLHLIPKLENQTSIVQFLKIINHNIYTYILINLVNL